PWPSRRGPGLTLFPYTPLFRSDEEDLGLVGSSPALRRVRELVRKAGPTDETVLVTGESGAGKELVARALHETSPRTKKPFPAINRAHAHRDPFDAALFRAVRGADTGAPPPSRNQPADGKALPGHQPRPGAPRPLRRRALRLRSGRLRRRHPGPARPLPRGGRRHPLSRRGGRAPARGPGEAPARDGDR